MKRNPDKKKIAAYGAFRIKGASPYFKGRYKMYGPYQWNIKFYDWQSDDEIEAANEAFFYDDFYDLKERLWRDVKVHIDGRSGGWFVIDEDLTVDEWEEVNDYINGVMKALPKFLKEYREENKKKNPSDESDLYEFLEKHHVFWDRDKDGNIWVMTSGYKTHHDLGHYGIEKVMMKYGYYMADEEFDRLSGQTKATYKKRKGKVKNPKSKNPFDGVAVAKKDRPRVSAKIRKLMHEGFTNNEAVAIALSMYAEHKLGPRGGKGA